MRIRNHWWKILGMNAIPTGNRSQPSEDQSNPRHGGPEEHQGRAEAKRTDHIPWPQITKSTIGRAKPTFLQDTQEGYRVSVVRGMPESLIGIQGISTVSARTN